MASPSARPWPATHPYLTGVPARVLPLALLVLALPFLLPGDVSVPEGAAAVIGGVIVASAGLDHPPYSPARAHWLTAALAFAALVLVAGQTVLDRAPAPPLVRLPSVEQPRAAAPAKRRAKRARAARTRPAPARSAPARSAPARSAPKLAAPKLAPPASPAPAPATTLREGTPVPAPAPAPAPAGAERFVREYYAALNGRRFATAWRMLTPSVRAAFGGFARWRGGYARTLASTPGALRVTPAGGGATVELTLRARDRGACGKTVVRRFAVTWHLARMEAGWRATAAAARALSRAAPAAAC